MLLSIVMMIKNEQKYLDKTLDALSGLRKKIGSEIIIVDTGSTDKSVEIAKKYTNKVYFEKWNNNFGSMRNKSISYASGEWILILDADEELVEYEQLVEFFTSNVHKKYNSATIELDNIISENEETRSSATMLRLFRNTKEFKYIGAIHEQPIYEQPIYESKAVFKHYGYLFENEEIKQLKDRRNKKILLEELQKNPSDAYMNYQLGKTYSVSGNFEDALVYMQKAYNLYKDMGRIPIFVISDLTILYMDLNYLEKCEKMCSNYIKTDNKNIDIYYYLATVQKRLGKYEKSLKNYKRYIYLLENYQVSTQATRLDCNGETISFKKHVEINIIDNYYKLEKYDEILNVIDSIEYEVLKGVYSIIFMTLYRFNKLEKVVDIYNKNSDSIMKIRELNQQLEVLIIRSREIDRIEIYNRFSHIEGTYGILNEVRLGKKLKIEEYNNLLINGDELYYSEFLYYAIKEDLDIVKLLKGVSYLKIQDYIEYLVINKKDIILDLYTYVNKCRATLDIKKLRIYECITKYLLIHGGLSGEKYNNLFLMYINYSYYCIRYYYKNISNDEELLDIVRGKDEMFVVNVKMVFDLKSNDKLKCIQRIKKLLVENPQYKKCIELLKKDIEKELNENEEIKKLKIQYKSIIENSINKSNFEDALKMISEYESIFNEEVDILNMKGIIYILTNMFNDAQIVLKRALLIQFDNFNTIFNLAYLNELLDEKEEALIFYKEIISNCSDEELINDSKNKVENMY